MLFMLRSVLGSSLKARALLIALGVATLAIGITQLHNMPTDVLPDVAPPTVEIQTESLGLSAAEVEQLVTVPLEQDLLNGLPWLDVIRSASIPGLSAIELVFEPGTNLLRARQLVQERLSQAHALPNVSSPPQELPPRPTLSRVMMIRLSSDRLSPIEMSVLARWTIRPRLLGVPGVANVSIWGQRERQLQVRVQPARLRKEGISLFQVIESTGNALWASPLSFLEASTPGTGGFIDTANQRLAIQHLQPIARAADLARVPIQKRTGNPLRLGDVAQVVEGHQPLIGDAVFTDGSALMLVVERFPGASILDVTRGVEEAFDALRPGLPGMKIDTGVYRAETYIDASIHNVSVSLLIGVLLLALVLIALLFEWRTALIITVSILLSLTGAGLVLYLRGGPINLVVFAGLLMALGVVIDDAIVDVEMAANRLRRQRMNGGGLPVSRIVLEAGLQMRGAMFFAALIIVVSALPLFFVPDRSGALFSPLAFTYLLTVGTSMVVALTVTPALSAVFLANAPLERRGSFLAERLQHAYQMALTRIVRAPRYAPAAVAAMAVAGLVAAPFLGRSTLPVLKDSNVLVRMAASPGTSLPEMHRLVLRAEREVRSVPGVVSVGAHIGRALMSDQLVNVDSAELWAGIDPAADTVATMASIRGALGRHPGFRYDVGTYPNESVERVLAGPDHPIVVRVYGQDPGILHASAEKVRRMLRGIDGIVAPRVGAQVREPVLNVRVDLAAARGYGIKPGDVRRAAATLVSGIAVGSLFEHQKVFDVVVWGAPDVRTSTASIRNLLIDTPGGDYVRLGDVADISVTPNLAVIRHENVSRTLAVSADVRGRDVGAVADDVARQLRRIALPLEYHAELAGDFAERAAATRHLLWVAVAAAIGVLLLLQAAVGSWRMTALLFVVLSVALAGPAIAAFIDGRVVSLGTIAGMVATLGIAARAGIALIRHYERLAREDEAGVGLDVVVRGSRDRVLPIVLTGATTATALVPVIVTGSVAGQELLHPMAVAMLGGVVTSVALALFAIPPMYLLLAPRRAQPRAVGEELEGGPVIDLTVHEEHPPAGTVAPAAPTEPSEPVRPVEPVGPTEPVEPVGGE